MAKQAANLNDPVAVNVLISKLLSAASPNKRIRIINNDFGFTVWVNGKETSFETNIDHESGNWYIEG